MKFCCLSETNVTFIPKNSKTCFEIPSSLRSSVCSVRFTQLRKLRLHSVPLRMTRGARKSSFIRLFLKGKPFRYPLHCAFEYRFAKALINFQFSIFNFPFNRRRPLQYNLMFCALEYYFAKFISFREDDIFPYIKGTFSIVGEDIILPLLTIIIISQPSVLCSPCRGRRLQNIRFMMR